MLDECFVYLGQLLILIAVSTIISDTGYVKKDISGMERQGLISLDFEVFGVVQGVFFRKYTQKQAKSLNLRGWCMNTEKGTVQGQLEGLPDKVNEMKVWLQTKGSPASRIEKVVFGNEQKISNFSSSDFKIRR